MLSRNLGAALVAVLLVAGLATACKKAGKGAAIGGASGAAVGTAIGAGVGHKRGHTGRGAGIGAGVGAAVGATAGAIIGHYMDKKEERLREKVKRAQIIRDGDNLIVKFASGMLFDTDEYDLRDDSQGDLTEFADVLKEFPKTDLSIEGHTDSRGTGGHNKKLSQNRAKAVTSYLAGKGVDTARMHSYGYGEDRPVSDNESVEGQQKNRRVEVKIVPSAELKQEAEEASQNPG